MGLEGIQALRVIGDIERLCNCSMHQIFNMTAGLSVSTFITAGLAIPHEQDKTKAMYSSHDLLKIYNKKSEDIDTYFRQDYQNSYIFYLWVVFCLYTAYSCSCYYLDNPNIERAYAILTHIVETEIKLLEKRKHRNTNGALGRDQEDDLETQS